MSKKLTHEFVKEQFEREGYTLLSKEYKGNTQKLDYVCDKGHVHSIMWNNLQYGKRCSICAGNAKLTLEQIRKFFEKEGYILLSKTYNNSLIKLDYRCHNSHEHSMTWGNWQQGKRCPTCHDIRQSINKSGPGNPSWKGGKSYGSYCPIWSDKEYKNDIKLRDNYKCLNPYCNKKDNRLHIHHIDYDKKNCEYKNLITLCGSCNAKANFDREWHEDWYGAIMVQRYNYKY